ncbi:hypothetical protein HNO89_003632 [Sporosarcina luteola]|nr:hypothetical protein [Sporosarcina luteola]
MRDVLLKFFMEECKMEKNVFEQMALRYDT